MCETPGRPEAPPFSLARATLSAAADRTTSYRIQSASPPRCSMDLSLRGTAVFLEGSTPSKTAGMSWRPSMPGTIKRLSSSTRPAWRKVPLMWPPPSSSGVRISEMLSELVYGVHEVEKPIGEMYKV